MVTETEVAGKQAAVALPGLALVITGRRIVGSWAAICVCRKRAL